MEMDPLIGNLTAIKGEWVERRADSEEAWRIQQLEASPELIGQLYVNYFADRIVGPYLNKIKIPGTPVPTYSDAQPGNPFHDEHDPGADPHDWRYRFRISQHEFEVYACNNAVELRISLANGQKLNVRKLPPDELTAERAMDLFIACARTALQN
jgi:hypothetical protein